MGRLCLKQVPARWVVSSGSCCHKIDAEDQDSGEATEVRAHPPGGSRQHDAFTGRKLTRMHIR